MHSLLQRQLRRHMGADGETTGRWQDLVAAIDDAYGSFDSDREMLERALELSSQELLKANARLRAIFESMPDTVFVLDATGQICDVKGAPLRHSTIEPEMMAGRSITNVLGKLAGMIPPTIDNVLETGSPAVCEVTRLHGEHSHKYEGRITPLNLDQVVLILRDLTDGKRSGELLELNERRLHLLLENTSELIMVIAADGMLRYASSSFERLLGYSPESQTDLNLLAIIDRQDIGSAVNTLKSVLESSGVHAPVRLRVRHRAGLPVWLEICGNN